MKVGIQLLLFDSGTEVVEAVGLKFAYPERIVLGFAVVDSKGFAVVDSKGFADSRSFAAIVAEGPVAEHILGRIVAGMGYRSWTSRPAVLPAPHRRSAGFEAEQVVAAAEAE
jgi:hypothetical protein